MSSQQVTASVNLPPLTNERGRLIPSLCLERFGQLSEFLGATRELWRPRPFVRGGAPWESAHPSLSAWARGLSVSAIDQLESEGSAAQGLPSPMAGWLARAVRLSAIEPLSGEVLVAEKTHALHISARKWKQIQALAGQLLPRLRPGEEVVDWCAGLSHLGRSVGRWAGCSVHAVERNPALCRRGFELAQEAGVALTYTPMDVLAEESHAALVERVSGSSVLVGLHSCGQLSDALTEVAVEAGAAGFAVVPCCPHAVSEERYLPRSRTGALAALDLRRDDLRLITAEEVSATRHARASRRREMVYRAGIDHLLRQASGVDEYHSLPPVPRSWMGEEFEVFCQRAAERFELTLPVRWNPAQIEAQAIEYTRVSRALGLVRGLFRRALEVWVCLDRGIALLERDVDVELGTFCPPQITPRNILLAARLR